MAHLPRRTMVDTGPTSVGKGLRATASAWGRRAGLPSDLLTEAQRKYAARRGGKRNLYPAQRGGQNGKFLIRNILRPTTAHFGVLSIDPKR